MDKEKLRAIKKSERLAMTDVEVSSKSRLIIKKMINEIDWVTIQKLHAYLPITKLNEVDTKSLLDYLSSNHLGIAVTIQKQSSSLPDEPFQNYDLVIVPTLAFDKRGYRLGWGGGFYDRFLKAQPQALKIGLCFEANLIDKIPDEPHDVPLDMVITEGIIVKRDSNTDKN